MSLMCLWLFALACASVRRRHPSRPGTRLSTHVSYVRLRRPCPELPCTFFSFWHSVSADVAFIVNAPPVNGVCTLDPPSGVALTTPFSLACVGFNDDAADAPFSYAYDVLPSGNVAPYLLRPAQPVAAFVTSLPATPQLNLQVCAVLLVCEI